MENSPRRRCRRRSSCSGCSDVAACGCRAVAAMLRLCCYDVAIAVRCCCCAALCCRCVGDVAVVFLVHNRTFAAADVSLSLAPSVPVLFARRPQLSFAPPVAFKLQILYVTLLLLAFFEFLSQPHKSQLK